MSYSLLQIFKVFNSINSINYEISIPVFDKYPIFDHFM